MCKPYGSDLYIIGDAKLLNHYANLTKHNYYVKIKL